jgi:nitroreductase
MGDTGKPDLGTIYAAVTIASRAPSAHNAQPWRWRLSARSVHLFADERRRLPGTDHEERELTIGCGAALHHAVLGFAALGWWANPHRLPDPARPHHLAALEFVQRPDYDRAAMDLVAASAKRRTDRRRYVQEHLPDAFLHGLVERATQRNVTLTPVTGLASRREIAIAMAPAGASRQLAPGHQVAAERPAGNVLTRHPHRRGMLGRVFDEGRLDAPPLDDGAVWMVVSTDRDEPADWLRAGEALSAVLLGAAQVGLASCTLSRVGDHEVARQVVGLAALEGAGHPQLLVRLGWPSLDAVPVPRTLRRDVLDIFDPWPADVQ